MATSDLIPFEITNNSSDNGNEELNSAVATGTTYQTWFPTNDADRDYLAQSIKEAWEEYQHMNPTALPRLEFIKDADDFHQVFMNKDLTQSDASLDSVEFNELINEANHSQVFVKDYLKERLGLDKYRMHFSKFGMIKSSNNSYSLPRTYNEICTRLEMMINALTEYGFTTQTYGVAYWQELYDRIVALQRKTQRNSGKKSMMVRDKSELRDRLDRAFRIIKRTIEAFYYDNPEAVLRYFGFIRERLN